MQIVPTSTPISVAIPLPADRLSSRTIEDCSPLFDSTASYQPVTHAGANYAWQKRGTNQTQWSCDIACFAENLRAGLKQSVPRRGSIFCEGESVGRAYRSQSSRESRPKTSDGQPGYGRNCRLQGCPSGTDTVKRRAKASGHRVLETVS
jgi:hypothetical protein